MIAFIPVAWCLSQTNLKPLPELFLRLRLLTVPHQPVTPRRDPALKDANFQVLDLIMSLTSRLSYLRYISCIQIFTEETMTTSFQKVEDTLFQVLRNGFDLPGTPFEAMFALPQTETSIEGSSLENPFYLPGIKVEHFRSFLRILYPLCVLTTLEVNYSPIYDKMIQHRPNTCRWIWWMDWGAESSNYVAFPRGSVSAVYLCALTRIKILV